MDTSRKIANYYEQGTGTVGSWLTRLIIRIYTTEWLSPAVLVFLSLVPIAAGAARMTQLVGGAEITPENARFFASPIPIVLHIVSVTIYSLVGAFQFGAGFRRKRPRWHRIAGRVLVVCGLVAGLSGLWMAHFYPWPAYDGNLLYGMRLLFGSAMVLSIGLGFRAVRRWDFETHRAWMIRGYAIGLGAGTQVFTHLPWLFLGQPNQWERALSMGAGWIINVIVAEWIIRKGPSYSLAVVTRGEK